MPSDQPSEPGFRVRDYRASDYAAVMNVWESTGLGGAHRGDDEEVIARTLATGGKFFLLVRESDDTVAGTSWLTVDGRRTYLHHFGIHPDYQGKGLSNMLLEYSLKEAKRIGMQIKLEVHVDNLKALNLYKKVGFDYLGDYAVYIIRDLSRL